MLSFQIRVLRHLEQVVLSSLDYISARDLLLSRIYMRTMPLRNKKFCCMSFIVESNGRIKYDNAKASGFVRLDRLNGNNEEWDFPVGKHGVVVKGDVYIRFYEFDEVPVTDIILRGEVGPGGQTIKYGNFVGRQLCFISFHTGMKGACRLKSVSFLK